mgnify:CR=1 FL=1
MITARTLMIVVAIAATSWTLGLNVPRSLAQEDAPKKEPDPAVEEDEEIPLLQEAIQLLEDADLNSLLEDRKLLQNLGDLQDQLPDTDTIMNEAQKRLLDLQASGDLPSEEIKAAASKVLDHPSQDSKDPVSGTSVLGPKPKKAVRQLDAAEQDKTIKIDTYGSMTIDYEKRVMVFKEDVVVTDEEFEIECDVLNVYLDEEMQVKRAIALGKMVIIKGEDPDGIPLEAHCQEAIYEGDRIILRGWPEISNAGRTIKAKSAKTEMGFDIREDDALKPWVDGPFDGALKKPSEKKP